MCVGVGVGVVWVWVWVWVWMWVEVNLTRIEASDHHIAKDLVVGRSLAPPAAHVDVGERRVNRIGLKT